MGLTIVRNLVERHNGSVSVHSKGVGEGSEFVVRLPRTDARLAEEVSSPRTIGRHVGAAHVRKILVVDTTKMGRPCCQRR